MTERNASDRLKARKRIPAAERRGSLIRAARKVFAERGFDGAKTSAIAEAAGVSEALLYRHFPSKRALYGAVLRQLIQTQNAVYDAIGSPAPSTESLVVVVSGYLRACVDPEQSSWREGLKVLLSSLAGDGTYAGTVYRRATGLTVEPLAAALSAARACGDIEGPALSPLHTAMFIEHVGTMISVASQLPHDSAPYEADLVRVVDDAIWFCCRGVGLNIAAITRCLAAARNDVPRIIGRPARKRRSTTANP